MLLYSTNTAIEVVEERRGFFGLAAARPDQIVEGARCR
jgi:hypothetical protein